MAEYTVDGISYTWERGRWVDRDGVTPPISVRQFLNRELEKHLAASDDALTDPEELAHEARIAVTAGQMSRAIRLAARAWRFNRAHQGRAAFLIGILRKAHRAEDALRILKWIPKMTYTPLMVTSAAALCDVERWEEAHKMIQRALASSNGKPDGETWAVWNRIKASRPDLCS